MNKLALVLLASLSNSSAMAQPAPSAVPSPSLEFFCAELLQPVPALTDYAVRFTSDFRQSISEAQLIEVFAEVRKESGDCVSQKTNSGSATQHLVILRGSKQRDVYLVVGTDEKTGAVSSLWIDGIVDESIRIEKWSDLPAAFTRVSPTGKMAATLVTADGSLHLATDESTAFAVGSTFKLYVLGALDQAVREKRMNWSDILPINDAWKSPSGGMDEWATGREVDLFTYGKYMISISDNTATDHLINHLGRENVEAMFSRMGNSHAQLPLFGTLEMFKLKWAVEPTLTDRYVLATEAERRSILDSLASVPRSAIGTNGVSQVLPTRISTIEWFATTRENCEAMFWLAANGSQEVRDILSTSTPFVKTGGHWKFVGYKGGSEVGVVSMTYLLESQSGNRACLSMSWNDEKAAVSEHAFFSLMKKTLALAESQVP